jgi:hypothetical protein
MATTTNYSWSTPDNTAYVKDGASSIRTLGSSVDTTLYTALGGAYPGLRLIKSQVVGSAVSSVTVNTAFSATYENYKIIYTGGVASTSTHINGGFPPSGTTYYNAFTYTSYATATPAANINNNSVGSWTYLGYGTTTNTYVNIDVYDPFLAKLSAFSGGHAQALTTGAAGSNGGFHNQATSYSSFFLAPASGTITGGTIYIYGYGAS